MWSLAVFLLGLKPRFTSPAHDTTYKHMPPKWNVVDKVRVDCFFAIAFFACLRWRASLR